MSEGLRITPLSLIVMAKVPELGKVKTRLAAGIGESQALNVYERLLAHTLTEAKRSGMHVAIHQTPSDQKHPAFAGFATADQPDGSLGERMAQAFAQQELPALMVGTDCPGLTAELLQSAAAALETYEVVLGPANDGGYYLIGVRQAHVWLFESMPWSTERVLEETIGRCRQHGVSYFLLPERIDIDTFDDLRESGFAPEITKRPQTL